MTVADLIARLAELPPELPVIASIRDTDPVSNVSVWEPLDEGETKVVLT